MGRRPTAQAEDDPDGILAISVTGGDFVWNLPPKEVDTEKATAKETKSNRQSSDPLKQSLLGAEDPTNSLVDDGSGILTRGDDPWAFRVEQVNIRVKKGSLVFVIGKIGCGKSSLLYALCGEMNRNSSHVQRGDPTPGELKVRGEIGLLSQSPWLISGTVLDNILLDKPLDPERLERALRCSQLELDIQEMAQGVHTFIGENGGSVSGGQRTRIALARLVYQDPDVLVLDDPLSALDLKVADRIMKEAICGELRDKTRIISTHAIHNLKYADYVYVMDQGRVVFEGTFSQMTESDIYNEFREVTQSFDLEGIAGNSEGEGETEEAGKPAETVGEQPAPEPAQEDSSAGELQTREMSQSTIEKADSMLRSNQTEAIDLEGVEEDKSKEGQTALVNKLFLEEDRVQGRLGFSTIQTCVRELGGIVPVILIMLSVFLMFGVMFLNDFYNLEWAKNFDPNNKFEYLKILLFLLYARPVIILIRGSFVFGSQLILSKNMHAKMMFRVLHAQIGEFLERVPAGRIINRFTKDIDVLDREIGYGLSTFYYSLGGVIVNIIVLVWTVGPILLLPLSVFLFVGAHYQRKVMNTKREVVRLQGVSRSPVISGLSGALKGLSEIRVLSKFGMVTQEFVRKLSDNAKNSFLISGLDSWYQIRINTINVCLIQIPGFAILGYYLYLTNEEYPIEKIILFVLRSMFISGDLTSLLLSIGSLESQLINLERCEGFSKIEPEARYLNFQMHEKKYLHPNSPAALKAIIRDLAKNEGAIISKGEVEFKDVYAKYPTKPNYVLQKLNLRVIAGQKIGIVGRTGAGKTSLIKLFWQCLEPCAGKVTFDGIDIMTADLKTLRSNMDIISQETAIFEGTLRENLDPKLEFLYPRDSPEFKAQDSKLLEKLYAIGFTDASLDYKGLDFPITAGGGNLSLGQRQLLSFMRILIAPKKLMILDEATANIDLKTEQLMQEAVKKEFKNSQQRVVKYQYGENSTMFIIAHRLQTVLDCDQIVLMERGEILEYGPPRELISKANGKFKEMVDKLQDNILD